MGASGTGTTTLANALSNVLDCLHLDTDEFYWEKTSIPYSVKVEPITRQSNLIKEFERHEKGLISGSLVSWGEYWETAFDLIIFLKLDSEMRMNRLIEREKERYGDKLKSNLEYKYRSEVFLEWAKKYDDPMFKGRSLVIHRNWLEKVSGRVIELDSINSIEYLVAKIRRLIEDQFH